MTTATLRDVKQLFVSEVYLERLLTSRVPAVETVMGALIWSGLVIGFVRDIGTALWMLSALVGVPLALRLASHTSAGPIGASFAWLRTFAVPAAAISSLALLTPGPISFLLSLPWLVLTVLVALSATFRFATRQNSASPMVAMDIGLMLIGVAGIAFTLSHLGVDSIPSREFHGVAYMVPVIVAEATRRREGGARIAQLLSVLLPVGVIATYFGEYPRMAGTGIVAVIGLVTALLAIGVMADHNKRAKATLVIGGWAIAIGSIAVVAAEVLTYLEITGRPLDLIRVYNGPLVVAGLSIALLGLALLPARPEKNQRRNFFHLGAPTPEQMSRLSEELLFQSPRADVNPLSEEPPIGYRLHKISRAVPDFENSCEALWTWAGHESAGIELTPAEPPILMGKDIAFTIPVGPFALTATGRIVALISDEDHYGFVYSTLDHHPFIGTEAIILDKSSGRSMLTISTVWRPNCLATRLPKPLVSMVIGKIKTRYLNGIAEAETATIGARMMDVLTDMNKRRYMISRDAIRSETTAALPPLENDTEVVTTQPLSEFEALFSEPLRTNEPAEDPNPIPEALR